MPLYEFGPNDIFTNRLETHPTFHFLRYYNQTSTSVVTAYDKVLPLTNTHVPASNADMVPSGFLSLYEMNVDRDPAGDLIYPFITKQGSRTAFKTISTEEFNTIAYGTILTGSYPMSASITQDYQAALSGLANRRHIFALKNTFNYYKTLSDHYAFSSSLGDKAEQEINLVSIPSIFYGSSIEKGTVDLRFYVTGSLVGQLQDTQKNGELRQILPAGAHAGDVAGVVLYNEGIIALTGSWPITLTHTEEYVTCGGLVTPQWNYWGYYLACPAVPLSSSWSVSYNGTNYIPTVTMLAHAPKAELNHSNNPTYLDLSYTGNPVMSAGSEYVENGTTPIKNIVKTPYPDPTGSFAKETYITKIGIYDDDNNLIAIANLANPVRKTEQREFTFKIKMDI